MSEYILHAVWTPDEQLGLWVEQVEGHRVLQIRDLPEGTLPPEVEQQLAGITSRRKMQVRLRSPRGRLPKLVIPVTVLMPQQAVELLSVIAEADSQTASRTTRLGTTAQWETIGAELHWCAHLVQGLRSCARSGRVALTMNQVDNQWYPRFLVAPTQEVSRFLSDMQDVCPQVLVMNSHNQLVDSIAHHLFHELVLDILADEPITQDLPRLHVFLQALLLNKPVARVGAQMLPKLMEWTRSVATIPLSVVVLVEEEAITSDDDEPATEDELVRDMKRPRFPVTLRLRVGNAPPERVENIEVPAEYREDLQLLQDKVLDTAPSLEQAPPALEVWPVRYAFGSRDVPVQQSAWDLALNLEQLERFVNHDAAKLRAAGVHVMLPKSWKSATARLTVNPDGGDAPTRPPQTTFQEMVQVGLHIDLDGMGLSAEEARTLLASQGNLVRIRDTWVMADGETMTRVRAFVKDLRANSRGATMERMAELADERSELLGYIEQLEEKMNTGPELTKAQLEALIDELHTAVNREHELAQLYAELESSMGLQSPQEMAAADLQKLMLEADPDTPVAFGGDEGHDQFANSLVTAVHGAPPDYVDIPDTVHAELRHYQRRGVSWLKYMSGNGLGCILADDMGLGKTLQTLALLAVEHAENPEVAPSLIVVPTSVVGNWEREIATFVPHLKVYTHYGPQRLRLDEEGSSEDRQATLEKFQRQVADYDIVLTTYGLLARDVLALASCTFDHVILDEAQNIKNPATKAAKAARAVPARQRIALTGTPVENRLADLRALLDWVNPGMLGSAKFFRTRYAIPIEREEDEYVSRRLLSMTRPFVLRRAKTDPAIIDDLPEKNETIVYTQLTAEQAALYKATTENLLARIEKAKASGSSVHGAVFYLITAIKQICNHPAHYTGDGSPLVVDGKHRSGKVEALQRIVEQALSEGEKVLVFTQYAKFGAMLAEFLSDLADEPIPFLYGQTSRTQRDAMVRTFQRPDGPPLMVLSLRAGGTGLNLTAANHVVHMDRWWNPAVENQATDRAFRIGQDRDVHVHKMVTQHTFEERIDDIISGKLKLASQVVVQGESWVAQLDAEDLSQLVSLEPGHWDDPYTNVYPLERADAPGESPEWDGYDKLDTDAAGKWTPSRVLIPEDNDDEAPETSAADDIHHADIIDLRRMRDRDKD
ncbi:ATP-dependent helicase [Corynebacterium sp. 13CS0277]|uniref:DEAD/DEAH box helicase n=1 Tax=Corynebacterium sp. 13CS0277 TaxID=2071994 RepID=UPI000D02FF84|nr:SNF2-related protein [Corynebacterium sp. 13CS0277]PRQ12310.1 ATP-dependent helicase [Corynebacterium sp. 13CS0277]